MARSSRPHREGADNHSKSMKRSKEEERRSRRHAKLAKRQHRDEPDRRRAGGENGET